MIKFLWKLSGFTCLVVGIIGIFLPLLPTTPFLLLAAFCFERGSERIHFWLVNHPRFGPPIENWRHHGAISKRAKTMAISMMVAVFLFSIFLSVPLYALAMQGIILCLVACFILTRPAPPTA
ncbi:MAG: YbaN family protein [Methyloligellaceae bacterium]